MSEKLSRNNEQPVDMADIGNEARERLNQLQNEALEAARTAEKTDLEALRTESLQNAATTSEIQAGIDIDSASSSAPTHFAVHKAHKADTYNKTMQRVRSRLNTPERALSKLTHQPKVDALSNVAAKTVARGSGILGSGIFALFGSSILLYLSREFGYAYNYTSFIALVIIGYFVGLLVELIIRSVKRPK